MDSVIEQNNPIIHYPGTIPIYYISSCTLHLLGQIPDQFNYLFVNALHFEFLLSFYLCWVLHKFYGFSDLKQNKNILQNKNGVGT